MDIKGDKSLDVDDFRWGLMDFGIQVTKDEAAQVLEHFDIDKNGLVNFDEFLRTLKVSKLKKKYRINPIICFLGKFEPSKSRHRQESLRET
jgi:Ca2+-binding EF-hand superfamily protein